MSDMNLQMSVAADLSVLQQLHAPSVPLDDDVERLVDVFNRCFAVSHNTILVSGDDEPVYLPADETCEYHRIIFAHGFFASALHEISHWCVAGPQRWLLEDFGYWYKPDGRSAEEQAEFERVEVKPQAYEWLFSHAAGRKFHFSADNLASDIGASDSFKTSVVAQIQSFLQQGLPSRPAVLMDALREEFGSESPLPDHFSLN